MVAKPCVHTYIHIKLQLAWGLRSRSWERVVEGGGRAAEVRISARVPRKSRSLSQVQREEEQSRQREQTMQVLVSRGSRAPSGGLQGPEAQQTAQLHRERKLRILSPMKTTPRGERLFSPSVLQRESVVGGGVQLGDDGGGEDSLFRITLKTRKQYGWPRWWSESQLMGCHLPQDVFSPPQLLRRPSYTTGPHISGMMTVSVPGLNILCYLSPLLPHHTPSPSSEFLIQ